MKEKKKSSFVELSESVLGKLSCFITPAILALIKSTKELAWLFRIY